MIEKRYQVVVVGGGISGMCAALAAARHGAKTALIQDRPVLGGNASSEIRMHICGADREGHRPNARETGIVEEILLENQLRNPQHSFSICDTILWEKTHGQENLDVYLNARFLSAEADNGVIRRIYVQQMTTEKDFLFTADIFIDATGDGMLAFQAGARVMHGREGKAVFGESLAPDVSDDYTMGNSLMFTARDMGRPVPFTAPPWAYHYTDADIPGPSGSSQRPRRRGHLRLLVAGAGRRSAGQPEGRRRNPGRAAQDAVRRLGSSQKSGSGLRKSGAGLGGLFARKAGKPPDRGRLCSAAGRSDGGAHFRRRRRLRRLASGSASGGRLCRVWKL